MRILLSDPSAHIVLAGIIKGAAKALFFGGVIVALILVFLVSMLFRRRR